jgi:cystathionine beta-lyase/cystathionine gamma-synthase
VSREEPDLRFETRAIHAGQEPEPAYGSVNVPIYQTSTYAQEAVGKHRGYDYARTGNPTRTALETAMASLEGGHGAVSFASGMAAEANLLTLLSPGDHVVLGDDVYGGTYRLLSGVLQGWGLQFDTADLTDLEAVRKSIRPPSTSAGTPTSWAGWS